MYQMKGTYAGMGEVAQDSGVNHGRIVQYYVIGKISVFNKQLDMLLISTFNNLLAHN